MCYNNSLYTKKHAYEEVEDENADYVCRFVVEEVRRQKDTFNMELQYRGEFPVNILIRLKHKYYIYSERVKRICYVVKSGLCNVFGFTLNVKDKEDKL